MGCELLLNALTVHWGISLGDTSSQKLMWSTYLVYTPTIVLFWFVVMLTRGITSLDHSVFKLHGPHAPAFEPLMQQTWARPPESVLGKLEMMRAALIQFNKETFGRIHRRKRRVEQRLNGVQRELKWRQTESLLHLEKSLREEYEQTLLQEELLWYRKSRENWVNVVIATPNSSILKRLSGERVVCWK